MQKATKAVDPLRLPATVVMIAIQNMVFAMVFSRKHIPLFVLPVLAAACTPYPTLRDAQYWQRESASSALYMQGPKAQQMLHQDIARCTGEIQELYRLGAIRDAVPGDPYYGTVPDPDRNVGERTKASFEMAQWETPERDGYLYAEHLDYHDFEGCMHTKGWERVEHVPYEVADRSRSTYRRTVMNARYRSRHGEAVPTWHEETSYAKERSPESSLND